MCSDFEDSGTIDALIRLCVSMSSEYEVPDLPNWMLKPRLDCFIGTEVEMGLQGLPTMKMEAEHIIPKLATLEQKLLRRNGQLSFMEAEEKAPCGPILTNIHLICLSRLLLGACCEAYACIQSDKMHEINADEQTLRQLYKDSCHAAVWTSSHAQYLHDIAHTNMSVARPSLHSVKCEFNELDLSDLYSRRHAAKYEANKDALCLINLLNRCTNHGSRGYVF